MTSHEVSIFNPFKLNSKILVAPLDKSNYNISYFQSKVIVIEKI